MGLFDSLVAEGNTVVMVTHDINVADHATRMIKLKDGFIEND
jgi:putative ABC transport system ATP-binding protein